MASSLAEIAVRESVTPRYVSRLLLLSFLAPQIGKRVLDGMQPMEMTVEAATRTHGLPIAWSEQQALFAGSSVIAS